jgi:miniconductance mechanosensitive channel
VLICGSQEKMAFFLNWDFGWFGQTKREEMIHWLNELLRDAGVHGDTRIYLRTIILLLCSILISIILWWITTNVVGRLIHRILRKSKTHWHEHLKKNKFFTALAHLVPVLFFEIMVRTVFIDFPVILSFLLRMIDVTIVLISLYIIIRFLNTLGDVLLDKPKLNDKPVASYIQLSKIVITILLIVLMVSITFSIDPIVIVTSMGALTAILLLIFKDTILGFVGSIQLAANDMIRIGDWITMEKFGADGYVTEINLATIKIQNFDKTITTIPTYSFISDSFKNWRGMLDSDGRRVMRSINIKIQSVKFCTPELLEKLAEIEIIRNYINTKQAEINEYNEKNNINRQVLLNGLNQTNLGIFRHYVTTYLTTNPAINLGMDLMVRQLEPTDRGVPVQLYAFTINKKWADYEAVMADIFDHLLASVEYFELEVFEQPAGSDMRIIAKGID